MTSWKMEMKTLAKNYENISSITTKSIGSAMACTGYFVMGVSVMLESQN